MFELIDNWSSLEQSATVNNNIAETHHRVIVCVLYNTMIVEEVHGYQGRLLAETFPRRAIALCHYRAIPIR